MQAAALTVRQQEVLDAIRTLSAVGRPPSYAEIGDMVKIRGSVAVRRHLSILVQKGFLLPRTHRKKRDCKLTAAALAA
jgi:SOS-response transcriptional repressor LexA